MKKLFDGFGTFAEFGAGVLVDVLADRVEVEGLLGVLHLLDELMALRVVAVALIEGLKDFLDGFGELNAGSGLREVVLVLDGGVRIAVRLLLLARVKNDVGGEVDDVLEVLRSHVEDKAHPGGDRLQIPDVGARGDELDVPESLSTPVLGDDFDAALFAGDALVADLFVFSAVAFVVFGGAEDLLAEEAAHLRFLRTVVDGFGFGDFAFAPITDHLRASKADRDGGEVIHVEGLDVVFMTGEARFLFRHDSIFNFDFIRHCLFLAFFILRSQGACQKRRILPPRPYRQQLQRSRWDRLPLPSETSRCGWKN